MSEKPNRLRPQVVILAFAALCNDTASEMIYPLLPLFITTYLGGSAFIAGAIEGFADAVSAVLKYYAGRLSDRTATRKPLVVTGYALPAISRLMIAAATTWGMVLSARLLDRTGKGIRSAPRDAIIADVTPAEGRGRAYGFHRALDHTGAVIGPLFAMLLLSVFALELRTVFYIALVPAFAGVVLLLVGLKEPPRSAPKGSNDRPRSAAPLPRSFKLGLLPIALFSLANSSDIFLLLQASRVGVAAALLPLLWALHHVVKAALSERAGALSDRIDRRWLLGSGWLIYSVIYLAFPYARTTTAVFALFIVYALPFALSEGAERAWVIRDIGAEARGKAFGAYYLTVGACTLGGTLLFGYLYDAVSPSVAFVTGATLAALAVVTLLIQPRTSSAA